MMFDVNMRYLPKGKMFFVDIHGLSVESKLALVGIDRSMVPVCEMLEEQNENPLVKIYGLTGDVEIRCSEEWRKCWLVYAGNLDFTGFISKESKTLAKHYLQLLKQHRGIEL